MSKDQYTMQDPRYKYSPPHPKPDPSQPEPALDKLLKPQADHGEKTYRGAERLAGRKALITGGDSGIGRAVAIASAREGADVAITHVPREEVDATETLKLIEAAGRKAVCIPGDITDESFCNQLVKQAVEELGSIDILVNNAIIQQFIEKIEDIPSDQFQEVFATNVFGMFWITKAATPHMPCTYLNV